MYRVACPGTAALLLNAQSRFRLKLTVNATPYARVVASGSHTLSTPCVTYRVPASRMKLRTPMIKKRGRQRAVLGGDEAGGCTRRSSVAATRASAPVTDGSIRPAVRRPCGFVAPAVSRSVAALQAGAARESADSEPYALRRYGNVQSLQITDCRQNRLRTVVLAVINTTIYPNRLDVSSSGAVRDRVVSWRRGAGAG